VQQPEKELALLQRVAAPNVWVKRVIGVRLKEDEIMIP